jgi:hypothetical protein
MRSNGNSLVRVCVLALACALGVGSAAYAQPRAPILPSQLITLQASQVAGIANTTTTRTTTVNLDGWISANILLNITNGGAATGTLQIFLQDSVDGGTTWDDLVASNTFAFGAAAAVQRFFISGRLIPSTVTTATSTNITQGSTVLVETLGAGSARMGPFGNRIRVREKVSGVSGSPTGPTYTITAVFTR